MSAGDITHVVTCTVPELMIYHAKAIAAKDAEIQTLRARVAELERANGVSESEFIARLRALNLPLIVNLDRIGKFDFDDFPKHLKKDAYSRVGLYPITRYYPEPPKS